MDLQAHRGGLGLVTENTLEAFATALELGVTTLELDVQITQDGHAVVTHDRRVSSTKCRDTAPATAGDPEPPYVGDYITNLTLAQVWTLDCGRPLPDHPQQRVVAGARMPLLSEVFALVDCYRAHRVWFNIETKVEAGAPVHGNPQNGKVGDPGYQPYTTPALVAEAHAAGLAVIPWTIDDPATMASLMDAGVDGIITNYPDRLRALVAERGLTLPKAYREPGRRDCLAEAAAV